MKFWDIEVSKTEPMEVPKTAPEEYHHSKARVGMKVWIDFHSMHPAGWGEVRSISLDNTVRVAFIGYNGTEHVRWFDEHGYFGGFSSLGRLWLDKPYKGRAK